MKFLVFAAVLVAAFSDDAVPPTFDPRRAFDMANENNDLVVSKSEFNKYITSFDDDKDGLVNGQEFALHFTQTGMSAEGSYYVFYKIDSDDNKRVESSEIDRIFSVFNNDMDVTYEQFVQTFSAILSELEIARTVKVKLDVLFSNSDNDNDGSLSLAEFLGLLNQPDKDGNDDVPYEEFKEFWMRETGEPENRTRALFDLFDRDNSGSLGGPDEKAALLGLFDWDVDNIISKSEFDLTMLWFLHKVMQVLTIAPGAAAVNYQKYFDSMDKNADGFADLAEYKAAYLSGDSNMDGVITMAEFIKRYGAPLGLSGKQVMALFFYADRNDDKIIDDAEINRSFDEFDRDMDGMMTVDEYETTEKGYEVILGELSAIIEKLSRKIDEVDTDKDGKLTFAEAYSVVDQAGDGIDLTEFQAFYQENLGATASESANFFYYYDTDKNGKIEGDDEVNNIFSSFDINKDGFLSKDEYINALVYQGAYILKNRPAPAAATNSLGFSIEAAFKAADNNSDGVITKDEFAPAGEISITEFVPAYMAAGLNRTQSLYIFFRVDDNEDQKVSQTELEDTFDSIDGDDDGKITLPEYVSRANQTFAEIEEAVRIYPRIAALFMRADADSDGNLTRTEMRSLLSGADQDNDGLASEAEFKEFWRNNTGEPESRTDLLFGYIDLDSDGYFGNDLEPANLFDGFDYNDDDLVSSQEFADSMLFLFARATGDLKIAADAGQILGWFF